MTSYQHCFMWHVSGFLRILQFSPIKLIAMYNEYNSDIVKSGIKHHTHPLNTVAIECVIIHFVDNFFSIKKKKF